MSQHDYEVSKRIAYDYPFYALIMAAMRQADTDNTARLRAAFPDVWAELQARYNAPGGVLPSDPTEGLEAVRQDLDAEFAAAVEDAWCSECNTEGHDTDDCPAVAAYDAGNPHA